jgi:VIT1/CCC1 family predicted Fe2+/Mn2+ transporter
MPQTPHVEPHFTSSEKVRDIVIGMSDGLTVPFALAAGLSRVVQSTGIVITAGLAEVAAGAIEIGLGGYLAEHYVSESGERSGRHSTFQRSRWKRLRASFAGTGCRRQRSRVSPRPFGATVAAGSSS